MCCEQGFDALPGWDPVTGFGSVDFTRLATVFGVPPPDDDDSSDNGLSTEVGGVMIACLERFDDSACVEWMWFVAAERDVVKFVALCGRA